MNGASPLNRYEDCYIDTPWDATTAEPEDCRGPYSNSTGDDNEVTCLTKECYHVCLVADGCCAALSSYEEGLGLIDIYGM